MGTVKSNCEEYCAFHELAGHRLIYVHLSGSMRPNQIVTGPLWLSQFIPIYCCCLMMHIQMMF